MAISPDHNAAHAHSKQAESHGKSAGDQVIEVKQPAVVHEFNRLELTSVQGVSEKGKSGNGVEKTQIEKVKIDENVHAQHKKLLGELAINLVRLRKNAVDVFNDPRHSHEKAFLEGVLDENGEVDLSRIDKFLSKPEGWGNALLLLDDQKYLLDAALGVVSKVSPIGERGMMIEEPTAKSRFQRLRARRSEFLHRNDPVVEPGPFGQGRTSLDKLYNPEKFKLIAGDPFANPPVPADSVQVKYLKEMTGFDLQDFFINPVTNKIEPRPKTKIVLNHPTRGAIEVPAKVTGSTVGPDVIREKQVELSNARRTFFVDALKIDPKYIDSSAEEWILHGHPERVGLKIYDNVMRELSAAGGLIDVNGEDELISGVENPNFRNAESVAIDFKRSTKEVARARQKALTKSIEEYMDQALGGNKSGVSESKGRIVADIADSGANLTAERNKRIDAQIGELSATELRVDGIFSAFSSMDQAVVAHDKAKNELGGKSIADISLQIKTNTDLLRDRSLPTSIGARKSKAADDRDALEEIQIKSLTEPDDVKRLASVDRIRRRAQEKYDDAIVKIQEDAVDIKAEISEAEKLKANFELAEQNFADIQRLQGFESAVNSMEYSYAELVRYGINGTDLESNSIDQIMEKINTEYVSSARGWPKELNGTTDRQDMVLKAMAQARLGQLMHSVDVSRADAFIEITTTTPVSEGRLIITDATVLETELAGRTPPILKADIEIAQGVARERLKLRGGAFEQVKESFANRTSELTEEKAMAVDMSVAERAAGVATLMSVDQDTGRKENVKQAAGAILEKPDNYSDASRTDPADSDTTLTQVEKDARVPRGYLEAMQLLYGYQESATRSKDFQRILKTIPPLEYAKHLNEFLKLSVWKSYTDPHFEADVYTAFEHRLADGMSERKLRQAFDSMVNRLADEVIASVS